MALRAVDQLGMDEQQIDDPDVEQALEDRQEKKEALSSVRKVYDVAHEHAKSMIERLELPMEGGAARVGRFRITRTSVGERHVVFDTKATTRLSIGLIDDSEGEDDSDGEE